MGRDHGWARTGSGGVRHLGGLGSGGGAVSVTTGVAVVARGVVHLGRPVGRRGRVFVTHAVTLRWDSTAPAEVRMEVSAGDGGTVGAWTLPREMLAPGGSGYLVDMTVRGIPCVFERPLLRDFLACTERCVPHCPGCGDGGCATCGPNQFAVSDLQ